MDFKLYKMYRLGIPQERIAMRLGETRERIINRLADPAILPDRPNSDLEKLHNLPSFRKARLARTSVLGTQIERKR